MRARSVALERASINAISIFAPDLPRLNYGAKVQAWWCFSDEGESAFEDAAMIADLLQDMGLSRNGFVLPAAVGFVFGCLTTLLVQSALRRPSTPLSVPPDSDNNVKRPARQTLTTWGGVSAEKRGTARRSGNSIPVFIEDGAGGQRRGFVVDRSAGGIGLALDYSVPIGSTLRVRPVKAPDTAPWVDVQVKSCRIEGSEFELGCQFLSVPPFNVMLLFG